MAHVLKELFAECRSTLNGAIIDALQDCTGILRSIERTQRNTVPVTGIALELAPWDGWVGLSARLSADFPLGKYRYNSADWDYFEFTKDSTAPKLQEASDYIKEVYEFRGLEPERLKEMAHLAFLAGAEALLKPNVAGCLREFDIDAPVHHEGFLTHYFEDILLDPDAVVSVNYCEIVVANRVTQRLLTDV